jgi:hypothetical protein
MVGSAKRRMLAITGPHISYRNVLWTDHSNDPKKFAALKRSVDGRLVAAGDVPARARSSCNSKTVSAVRWAPTTAWTRADRPPVVPGGAGTTTV